MYITFGTVFNDNDDFRTLARVPTTFDATFVATVGPRGDPTLFGVPASNLHALIRSVNRQPRRWVN